MTNSEHGFHASGGCRPTQLHEQLFREILEATTGDSLYSFWGPNDGRPQDVAPVSVAVIDKETGQIHGHDQTIVRQLWFDALLASREVASVEEYMHIVQRNIGDVAVTQLVTTELAS